VERRDLDAKASRLLVTLLELSALAAFLTGFGRDCAVPGESALFGCDRSAALLSRLNGKLRIHFEGAFLRRHGFSAKAGDFLNFFRIHDGKAHPAFHWFVHIPTRAVQFSIYFSGCDDVVDAEGGAVGIEKKSSLRGARDFSAPHRRFSAFDWTREGETIFWRLTFARRAVPTFLTKSLWTSLRFLGRRFVSKAFPPCFRAAPKPGLGHDFAPMRR
jgi:hypothetical protein